MGYRFLFGMMAYGMVSIGFAAPLTPAQQAFADAQALAASAQANAVSNLSSGGVSSTVNQFNPTYYNSNGTAPESTLFQGGNGNTVSAGQTKVADCQTGTPNPDLFLRQNCEAINLMVNNPSNRPQIAIPQSLFAASRAIEAQGVTDPNATGSFTSCVNKTVTPPPTTEICTEWFGTASQQCTMGRVVVVDANTNYQCDKTATTYLPQSCDKTLNVTVTQPPPIPATLGGGRWVVAGGGPPYTLSCPTDNHTMTWWNTAVYTYLNWRCDQVGCYNGTVNNVCPYDYSCPTGTTRTGLGTSSMCVQPPIVSSSVNNGCSVLEAAAL